MIKEVRIYNGVKTVSSVGGVGETGQLQVRKWRKKKEIKIVSNII